MQAARRTRVTQARVAAAPPAQLTAWLSEHGAPQQGLEFETVTVDGGSLDVLVAAHDVHDGDVVLRIPDHLVVTLDRVFDDSTVAEVLTTGKFSELACLTLYLMYEKKLGRESVWYEFIKELDRQRARGPLAAESPLLWTAEEVEEYLRGSPLQAAVRERLRNIRAEYEELDTVWFMSGSLFNNYPYDVPTEAFSFELFRQAFAAVQASVVHLQGVPLARRFALVPLGPPALQYSSTCKALIAHDDAAQQVTLAVDRPYAKGERVFAWCGPQPNSRLLLNYGFVDESNPFDKWLLTATIPNRSPLFQEKRRKLEAAALSTKHDFKLGPRQPLPDQLLPFLQVCYCTTRDALDGVDFAAAQANDPPIEGLRHLAAFLQARLQRYDRTMEEDEALLAQDGTPVRQRVACRLLIAEKRILVHALHQVLDRLGEAHDADFSLVPSAGDEFVQFS